MIPRYGIRMGRYAQEICEHPDVNIGTHDNFDYHPCFYDKVLGLGGGGGMGVEDNRLTVIEKFIIFEECGLYPLLDEAELDAVRLTAPTEVYVLCMNPDCEWPDHVPDDAMLWATICSRVRMFQSGEKGYIPFGCYKCTKREGEKAQAAAVSNEVGFLSLYHPVEATDTIPSHYHCRLDVCDWVFK